MPEDITINEDGTPVLIEAVYYRYNSIYAVEFGTIEVALVFLEDGEDAGALSSVGVFVDGKPHTPYATFAWPEKAATALDDMAGEYKNLPPRPKST